MKKIWLLFLMLFLAACGGGGGGGGTTESSQLKMGSISIQLHDGTAKTVASATGTRIRIVVSNKDLTISGRPFKVIRDEEIGYNNAIEVALPVATGYNIEALRYATDSENPTYKMIETYGLQTANVVDGVTPPVTLSLEAVTAPITVTLPAGQGFIYAHIPVSGSPAAQTYNLKATLPAATPLNSTWYAHINTKPYLTTPYVGSSSVIYWNDGKGTNVNAPNSFSNEYLYIQPVFNIKSSLLNTDEAPYTWTFVPPRLPLIEMKINGPTVNLNSGTLFTDDVKPQVAITAPTSVVASNTIPITVSAFDNGRVVSYRIWQSQVATAPGSIVDAAANPGAAVYSAITQDNHLPTQYDVPDTLAAGTDYYLKIYVSVKDFAGNEPVAPAVATVHIKK